MNQIEKALTKLIKQPHTVITEKLGIITGKLNKIVELNEKQPREYCWYYTIMLYQSLLCEISNIWETFKNNCFDDAIKKTNKLKFLNLLGLLDKSPNYLDNILNEMINLIIDNPFFLWNLHFIWIKHDSVYFDKDGTRWNYSYRCYKLFFEIAKRCIFNKKEILELNDYFQTIMKKCNLTDAELWDKCSEMYYAYGDKLQYYFGLVYDSQFRNMLSDQYLINLKNLHKFFEFLQTLDEKDIEINKYSLWKLFEDHQKS